MGYYYKPHEKEKKRKRSINYISPNPSELLMAATSLSLSLSLVLYSGMSRWLKQVWAEGRRSESGPCREITSCSLPSPPIGERSLPVVKESSRFFSSSVSECTTSQKFLFSDVSKRRERGERGEGRGGRGEGRGERGGKLLDNLRILIISFVLGALF